jgi:hypothetical protein
MRVPVLQLLRPLLLKRRRVDSKLKLGNIL